MAIVTVGIDLAKNVFAVHGVDATGKPVLMRTGAMVERYAHLAPDHLIAAARRLDSVLPSYVSATEPPKEMRPASLQAA